MNDLNLDDMKPWSVISTKLPHEYEAEIRKLNDEAATQEGNLECVATQLIQLHMALSEALGLEFEPHEDIERYTEVIDDLKAENKRLRELAEFMVQRAMQIEEHWMRKHACLPEAAYSLAHRQIEAYENEIGEAVRDEKSV